VSGGDNAQWSEEDQGEWRRQRTVEEGAVAVHGREGKVALVVDLAHLASTSSSPAAVEEGWQRHTVEVWRRRQRSVEGGSGTVSLIPPSLSPQLLPSFPSCLLNHVSHLAVQIL
jgi:hypothetical protein